MKVLSLCDGMSIAHIALDRIGMHVDKYYAAEIKDVAIKVTKENYPDTIHIGDVNKVRYKGGILYTENGNYNVGKIDLMVFGSPCQSFSIAMKTDMRIGLKDKVRSGLFLECYRILQEVQPTWFLLENVASMKDEDRDCLTEFMGVEPIRINSKLVSAALRDRYYWTNIQGITQPKDKGITLQSILTSGYTDREKARDEYKNLYECQSYYKKWEDLSEDETNKWYEKYFSEKCGSDKCDLITYENYFDYGYLETFVETYTSESGDKIVAFGEYGYDG